MSILDRRSALGIASGAIAGALLRYYVTLGLQHWLGGELPWGTVAVNLTGAMGLGVFTTWAVGQPWISPDGRFAIVVGFFGSYTTFSTYELDTHTLLATHPWPITVGYGLGTAIFGVLGFEGGRRLGNRWGKRRS